MRIFLSLLLTISLLFLGCSKTEPTNDSEEPVDFVEKFKEDWGSSVWSRPSQMNCNPQSSTGLSGDGNFFKQFILNSSTLFKSGIYVDWTNFFENCTNVDEGSLNFIKEYVDENNIQKGCGSIPYENSVEKVVISSTKENQLIVKYTSKQDLTENIVEYIVYPNVSPVELYEYREVFGETRSQVWILDQSPDGLVCF